MKPLGRRLIAVVLVAGSCVALGARQEVPFDAWLTDLIGEARQRGFSDELVQETLVGLSPIERVIARDRSQAELVITFDRYYRSRVSPRLIRQGQELMRKYRTLLSRVERDFGVQRRFLLALWGMESHFGANSGRTPVFRALATLAWEPRRSTFFRSQLFDALTMASRGDIEPERMTGSWAGAMGQTQFMPSSYLQHAVDYDGDGRRDIWRSVPDVLASMANYLKAHGWDEARTWGREIRLTDRVRARAADAVPMRAGSCFAKRDMTEFRPLAEWQRLGVRRDDGRALPTADLEASLVQTAERDFLVYPNYDALLGYNCAHHYALSVALMAERIERGS